MSNLSYNQKATYVILVGIILFIAEIFMISKYMDYKECQETRLDMSESLFIPEYHFPGGCQIVVNTDA